jgi:hypothetical protein
LLISDSIRFSAIEVWLENSWRYGSEGNKVDLESGYQLCIISTKESLIKYLLVLVCSQALCMADEYVRGILFLTNLIFYFSN